MLEIIKFVLEKIDFAGIAKHLRESRNRRASAKLFLILSTSYDVIELYRTILEEMQAALSGHTKSDTGHRFHLNHYRMRNLLQTQWQNLERLDLLISEMGEEVSLLENGFGNALREILPYKFGILFEAQQLLAEGRLGLGNTDINHLAKGQDGKFRTLWFTSEPPTEDRDEIAKYLHGWNGTKKDVHDVNFHDGDEFFKTLKWYIDEVQPFDQLDELERLVERYKTALIDNLTLEDVLSEFGALKRYENWTRQSHAHPAR
ncbi:hypothetical protein BBF93_04570 [Hyphomonas sp. CACIAM 19H1]|nr:hypothetical protein BBF93_04570 [Hyphomonas sp. CACIAM 19H1]